MGAGQRAVGSLLEGELEEVARGIFVAAELDLGFALGEQGAQEVRPGAAEHGGGDGGLEGQEGDPGLGPLTVAHEEDLVGIEGRERGRGRGRLGDPAGQTHGGELVDRAL